MSVKDDGKGFEMNASVSVKGMGLLGMNERAHIPVSYTHLRAHETVLDLVCRLLLEKKKNKKTKTTNNTRNRNKLQSGRTHRLQCLLTTHDILHT